MADLLLTFLGWPGNGWTNLWGGFIGDSALFAAAITWYVHSRCHVDGCHKHAKYPFQHYKLCKNHHPGVPKKVTHLHIKQLHKATQDNYER